MDFTKSSFDGLPKPPKSDIIKVYHNDFWMMPGWVGYIELLGSQGCGKNLSMLRILIKSTI